MKTNWKNAKEVVFEELGEGALLVDLSTGQRWMLNKAAVALWKLDSATSTLSEFCACVKAGTIYQLAGVTPTILQLGVGSGPRRRPSPRGNSGPG